MVKKTKKKKATKKIAPVKKEIKNTNIFESKIMKVPSVVLSGLTIVSIIITFVYYCTINGIFNLQNFISLLALAFPMYVIYFSIIKPANTKNTEILYWLSITIMLIIVMLFISSIFKGNFCYWFTNTCSLW